MKAYLELSEVELTGKAPLLHDRIINLRKEFDYTEVNEIKI